MTETAPLDIQTPRVFAPLLQPARYKGVWGGRGSGKSHFFAEYLVAQAMMRPGLRAVCIREIQKSLNMSVKQLVTDKIMAHGLADKFELLDKEIRTPGDGVIIFQGMQNHTADSIKSLEGFDVAWVEEAQSLSAHSLKLLRPTIRKRGSEIWFSWNPSHAEDPVDAFLRTTEAEADPKIVVVCANWSDNPWFPAVLNDERERDQRARPDEYDHIWEGGYQQVTEALIFRYRVEYGCDFEAPEDARLYYGVDWGFAKDPTAIVRCFITDDVLHIDYAEGGVGVEMDALPALFDKVPGTRSWPILADCARPETISFMANKYGYRITGAKKWKGSVEDGIERLKGFRGIRVHKRAEKIAREFRTYSYKVDRQTEAILPKIEDANNHWIDATRYALDGLIQNRRKMPDFSAFAGQQIVRRSFV
ncbi:MULTISPECIES: PBSX family phage terminase large subunit [unclassified Saccharibacter]|uniref:PBSX family phage terminase large subunit n=1 Tax=unclassified Saccharibacter TaxID=2648722 RepID=UPI0013251C46|nr:MULTISPECIES: PBSX family phage terminase large subunit [unclassified Saccharibacter]MXV35973.1 PBSX family phage terminase large subunit [Saccharibacter sp. EH611]MXV58928.1 PBSX family phage terminase large subunit [Saccharibacter sp. EH70]MXV65909.1 PBSX family phage terminase large subunit [Saccharibacter sp. EH60]